jgi:anti-sigma factor RsiW
VKKMNECRRTADRMTPYVDDVLPPAERAEVDRHLDVCRPCGAAAREEQGGRTVLREKAAALRSATLPPGLRTRCEALARAQAAPARLRVWGARLLPVSLSAIIIVFTASAVFSFATHRSDVVLAAQLTADHAKCFKLFAGEGAPDADAIHLEQMLSDRYGWDVHVPPSSAADGVRLVGARRCLYADGRMPHVMYRVNGQDVSLYMLEGVTRAQADVVALGHRARIWSRGATTYVMVSHGDAGEMDAAARYVMQEAH